MAKVLERLLFIIDGDSRKMQVEMKKAEGVARRSGKAMEGSFDGLSRRVKATEAALGLFSGAMIAAADAIAKTADSIGISTDALQEMRFAADLAGVSQEKLDKALQKATRNIGELGRSSSELDTALRDLAPSLLENMRAAKSVEEALDLAFRAMAEMENQTQRAAVANAIFGRSGILMTKIVRDGADAFDEARASARRLGIVIEESLLRRAVILKDQMTILGTIIRTNFTRGVISGFSEEFVLFADAVRDPAFAASIRSFGDDLGGTLRFIVENARPISAVLAGLVGLNLGSKFGPLVGVLTGLAAGGTAFVMLGDNMVSAAEAADLLAEKMSLLDKIDVDLASDNFIESLRPGLLETRRRVLSEILDLELKIAGAVRSPAPSPEGAPGTSTTTTPGGAPSKPKKSPAVGTGTRPLPGAMSDLQRRILTERAKLLADYRKTEQRLEDEADKKKIEGIEFVAKTRARADEFAFNSIELLIRQETKLIDEVAKKQADGVLDEEQALKARLALHLEFNSRILAENERLAAEARRAAMETARVWEQSMIAIEDVMIDGLVRGKLAWRDFAAVAIKSIRDVLLEQTRAAGGVRGSFLGPVISGIGGLLGFRHGGPVAGGQAIVVGEGGEELFIPPSDGVIIPNHLLRLRERSGGDHDRNRSDPASYRIVDQRAGLASYGLPTRAFIGAMMGMIPGANVASFLAGSFARYGVIGDISPAMGTAAFDREMELGREAARMSRIDAMMTGSFGRGSGDFAASVAREFGGLGGGGEFGGGFGGGGRTHDADAPGGRPGAGFAMGGPIHGGTRATVGERGAELFVPGPPPLAPPAPRGAGVGPITVNQYNDFSNADDSTIAALDNRMALMKREILTDIHASAAMGGDFARLRRI